MHIPTSIDDIQVGDIFHSVTGYSMVINDFYQVISRTPRSVVVRKLRKKASETGFLSGTEEPVPGQYADYANAYLPGRTETGDGVYCQKRCMLVDGLRLRIDSCETATPWDGNPCRYDHCD